MRLPPLRLRMRSRSSLFIMLAAAALGLATLTGIGGAVERALEPLRFGLFDKAASGRTVVVEMDAASAAEIRRWPWPRGHYATVIDHLRRAGAASIVFDVDLSASSDPAEDARLAAALARSDGLVALPTFSQQASAGDRRHLDALPPAAFRDHAALVSVSVAPDTDGLVRSMPLATITAGTPRPSLSSYIAARRGVADESFPIDFSIDPATVPRLSFVAVEAGRFDPAAVRGRNVVIGATAIEMGDRYAASYRGVLPGVVIQALAAETLFAGVPGRGTGVLTLVVSLLLALPIVHARRVAAFAQRFVAGVATLFAAVMAAQHLLLVHYPLATGLLVIASVAALCVARDIVRRFRAERLVDEPTGLPNQRAFLADAAEPGATVAVVQINNLETLSAVLGTDQLVQAILRAAERLRLASADDRVYRVRSHHLALLLPADQPVEDTMAALRAVLLEPVEVAGRKVDLAVVVGVSAADDLAGAALAAEAAVHDGVFWRRASGERDGLERAVSLMGELDAALGNGEIEVHYQPKLCLATDRIASVEALVRWRHPVRGFTPPDLFIPLAEQTDRIGPLTLHVLTTVLRDTSDWRARGHRVTAAVNISAKLLAAPDFIAAVDELLARSDVPGEALIFEVTESAAMSDHATAVATLNHYRERGIAVSMDDYGTGQSTLSYIRELPLNELKIDRSFVQHAHERSDDAALVRSTIELAHTLGLKVVAEGIEDAANLAFLKSIRCDYAQGYFISRPITVTALLVLLQGEAAAAA